MPRIERITVAVGWVNGEFRYEERTLLIHDPENDDPYDEAVRDPLAWRVLPTPRATESFPRCTTEVPIPEPEEWLPQWDELLPGEKERVYAVTAMTGEDWDPHRHPKDHPGPPPGQTYREHLHRVLARQLAWHMSNERRRKR